MNIPAKMIIAALLVCCAASTQAEAARFVRGDADGSKELDISDAILVLSHLFLGAPQELSCPDAGDVDDNSALELTDAIYLLTFVFVGGAQPPAPYPLCGNDPTEDKLACETFEPCAGVPCGGFAGIPCEGDAICDPPPGACGGADLPGECISLPADCPKILLEVCGCDGNTYQNDCLRLKANVQKDHDGPCQGKVSCGGLLGIPCEKGFFCEFPDFTCGNADLTGECLEIPEFCILIFDPVCGCDGITYSNDCHRRGAGISKLHDGPCEENGRE